MKLIATLLLALPLLASANPIDRTAGRDLSSRNYDLGYSPNSPSYACSDSSKRNNCFNSGRDCDGSCVCIDPTTSTSTSTARSTSASSTKVTSTSSSSTKITSTSSSHSTSTSTSSAHSSSTSSSSVRSTASSSSSSSSVARSSSSSSSTAKASSTTAASSSTSSSKPATSSSTSVAPTTTSSATSTQTTAAVCTDIFKILLCTLEGKGTDGNCGCTCSTLAQQACSFKGGYMNSDCSCIEPTYRKRARSIRCPTGLSACATYSSSPALKGAFECLDTRSSLEACGGCPGTGGVDCSAIDNADDVTCEQSRCVIRSCAPGYTVSDNGAECVEDESSTKATGRRIAVQSLNGVENFWGL